MGTFVETKVIGQEEYNYCPECNNDKLISDFQKGEEICPQCGVIIEDNLDFPVYHHSFKINREDNINKVMGGSLAQYDKGLSTHIASTNIDASGYPLNPKQLTNARTLRHWDKISKSNRSRDRNFRTAFSILLRTKEKLSLNDIIIEKSAYYYRRIVDLKLTKGRSIEKFIAACVYLTCREFGIPRTLDEISTAIGIKKVDTGKYYRILIKQFDIRVDPIESGFYINKIANNVGLSMATVQKATEMMVKMKKYSVYEGKDPAALSTAILYAACLEQGENTRQSQIAEAGEISLVNLRKRFLDIKKVFPIIPNNFKKINARKSNKFYD
ncbi:MAG: transcription initiation factor IIB [Nitrososphaeraceae archaeon]|nr:transcription initiation factor IIB [Nitrososphaeraceae archaeon]